jgi:hypothetical protein
VNLKVCGRQRLSDHAARVKVAVTGGQVSPLRHGLKSPPLAGRLVCSTLRRAFAASSYIKCHAAAQACRPAIVPASATGLRQPDHAASPRVPLT